MSGRESAADSETDTSSDQEDDSECCSSDASDVESEEGQVWLGGLWILNTATGWSHKAVPRGSDGARELAWAMTCRPAQQLGKWYELREQDPTLEGYSACKHPGCFG